MKITIIAIAIVVILALVYLAYQGHLSKADSAPGLVDGKLAACPGTPNCVCSEHPGQGDHAIEPIALQGESAGAALQRLEQIIEAQGGKIAAAREDYIAATFSSALFGFVDDLEVRIDSGSRVIHLRSASRVGISDLGANSKRVDLIKQAYREQQ